MRPSFALTPLLVALTLCPATASGQPAPRPAGPGAPPAIDAATRRAVIDSAAAALAREYVDADTGRLIADHLRRRLRDGAYNAITEPTAFALAVSTDLKAINGDEHLYLSWGGSTPGAGRVPVMVPAGAAPPGSGPVPMPMPSGGPAGGAPMAMMRPAERLINHGLRKVEILPGNIGYLLVDEFAGGDGVADAIAGALRFLERTDAIIIDVRTNRGGRGDMSHLLFSHFLPATPVPTVRVRDRLRNENVVFTSDSVVPGPRRPDVPLYVLTSRNTVSAAEEFAFVLRRLGRATLVGDRTIGAGHMNAISPIGNGFTLSVSFARVSDPVTGAEWERVGVQPTLVAPPAMALDVAQAHALRTIAARSDDPMRAAQLRQQAEVLDARAAGRTASAAALAVAPGRYTGGRLVEAVGGVLWYTGLNGQRTELIALPEEWFALGDQRMRFEGDRIVVKRPDGSTYAFERMR
ncbi:MAG: S41 family peptidase [Gemmatimonadaceae bacterium]|jgi:hypothetical protein|nr:S41 family peptidase [Gemmatimonadaceae bacterium]